MTFVCGVRLVVWILAYVVIAAASYIFGFVRGHKRANRQYWEMLNRAASHSSGQR